MSRSTVSILVVFAAFGSVVAVLPGQDSSRRVGSRYRPSPGGEFQAPGLVPPGADAGAMPPAALGFEAGVQQPFATNAPPAELADDRLRSVLKRSRQPETATAPAVTPPETTPPASPPPNPIGKRISRPVGAAAPRITHRAATSARSPALKVDIAGPPGITAGKVGEYVVQLTNEGDSAAEDVQLRVILPPAVTIQGSHPTNGEAAAQFDTQGSARLVWSIPQVAPRGQETLRLQVVAQGGDNFDLAVEWTTKPTTARAAITIKQPQLALSLAGPSDMTFGEEKTFTLTVSNPGTGDAEKVMLSVVAGNSPPQQFDAGNIPAGHKKEVPLAVVASQAGAIDLQITASGEGGLEARTAVKVNVRKAEVTLAIEGPPHKFAGAEAIYLLTVTNSGTAAADSVNLSLALPPGGKYVSGIEGANSQPGAVKWKIASLAPGGERQYEVRVQLNSPGENQVAVESQATASGIATCFAQTDVEAISELKLVVNDPTGPLPTGDQAVYELTVMNRGSQAARQVRIIMQFSEGVEPVSFEGCEARLVPGQVLCHPLAQLGPGEQTTLRVKAKAEQPGAHHFRVEVTSAEDDSRLVSEGTTRFFVESGRSSAAASTAGRQIRTSPTTIR
jgi:hypothetical protein